MDQSLRTAFLNGYERMAAWSNLLDEINLYPVADADTGRNLRISLAPLKSIQHKDITKNLLMSATGNSGNIAGAFFSKFVQVHTSDDITDAADAGQKAAWRALHDPKPGTMLAAFDALVEALHDNSSKADRLLPGPLLSRIKNSVLSTSEQLDELRCADVVDSGALGMFLFFEGFFRHLANQTDSLSNPYDLFGAKLKMANPVRPSGDRGYCIDTMIIPSASMEETLDRVSAMGEHVVALSDGTHLKVHLHAADATVAQNSLSQVGDMLHWQSQIIDESRPAAWLRAADHDRMVHIATDAAGSLTHDEARKLGITLLDSYITMDGRHLPESLISPDNLYAAMSRGTKVTTAQASIFERHQHYEYLVRRYSNLVYLCVGSAYTGNFDIASRWANQNGHTERMAVLDTGAASGRLGLIARRVAAYATSGRALQEVARFAQAEARNCDELIFLEQLKYLASGGRISKTNGFLGDLLRIKPVIRPGARGAEKIGVVKSQNAQLELLLDRLRSRLDSGLPADILLQYTDNQDRVVSQIQPRIQSLLPLSRISVAPMSLTAGVHMGPGTWAVAFCPANPD